ncbi:cell division protein FtsZ [Mycoplasmoides pirum]|uniref:cell division protein FtsZ n=1 Tax=Mycoplasmoides pirum TaxID=2122 RepID=UPI0006970A33|nr:cell division protein FtsZ [Mycoplasmoides pirum]
MKKYNQMQEVLSNFDFEQTEKIKVNLSKSFDSCLKTDELFQDNTKTIEQNLNTKDLSLESNLNSNEIKTQFFTKEEITNESREFFDVNLDIKKPSIKVIGIGGAGNNIVDYISNNNILSSNVTFYQLNTDSQHLQHLKSKTNKVLIESKITKGMGSGGDPECGRLATEDFESEIRNILSGADVCILIAGLGKGTGTGGSPVIGKIAKSMDILTLAFATMPSLGEGKTALNKALLGLKELKESVDAITTISNEKALFNSESNNSIFDAYKKSNLEIGNAIKSITDIILLPSYQNIDLADVKNFFSSKNSVNYFLAIRERFTSNEVKDINRIINRKLNELAFEQSILNAKSTLILFYANKEVGTQLYTNTTSILKELSMNKDLNIVYGIVETDNPMIGFDIIALNNEPTVLTTNISPLTQKIDVGIFDNKITTNKIQNTNNLLSRKFNRINEKSSLNSSWSKTANKLEDDFNDLIETKKLTTDQMSKILNRSMETYFDKKSNNLMDDFTEYDDLNLFKS